MEIRTPFNDPILENRHPQPRNPRKWSKYQRETVYFQGRPYHRWVDSPWAHLRTYFWSHPDGKLAPVTLHKAVWESAHGPVPEGFHVHHQDENTSNNDISNLELLSREEHERRHSESRRARGRSPRQLANLQTLRDNRAKSSFICTICSCEYVAFPTGRNKYCSSKCLARANTRTRTPAEAESRKLKAREYRARNPEKSRAATRRWQEKNRERCRQKALEYYYRTRVQPPSGGGT